MLVSSIKSCSSLVFTTAVLMYTESVTCSAFSLTESKW